MFSGPELWFNLIWGAVLVFGFGMVIKILRGKEDRRTEWREDDE